MKLNTLKRITIRELILPHITIRDITCHSGKVGVCLFFVAKGFDVKYFYKSRTNEGLYEKHENCFINRYISDV